MRELNRLNMILRLSIFQGKADFYSLGIHKNLLRNKIINLHMFISLGFFFALILAHRFYPISKTSLGRNGLVEKVEVRF